MDQGAQKQPIQSAGPMIGIIIILIVVFLGAAYFWGGRLREIKKQSPTEATSTQTAAVASAGPDDLNSLDAELGAFADTNITLEQ